MPPAAKTMQTVKFETDAWAETVEAQENILPSELMIYGQPGSGKTTAVAKASKYWPRDKAWWDLPPEKREWVVLKDFLWLAFDNDATISLRAMKIRVGMEINVPKLMSPLLPSEYKEVDGKQVPTRPFVGSYQQLIPQLVMIATEAVQNRGVEKIAVDTVSMLDSGLNYMALKMVEDEIINPKNTYAKFDKIAYWHSELYKGLAGTGVPRYYLFHTAVNSAAIEALKDDASEVSIITAEAKGVVGENLIKPKITGQSAGVYMGNNSLVLIVKGRQLSGQKGGGIQRYIEFQGDGYQAKNRYEEILKGEQPPDLGLIEDKLRNVTGATQ